MMTARGVSRTQLMPGHSMGTLHTFARTSVQNAEATRGVWGDAFQVDSAAILGHTVALNQDHFDHAFGTNLYCTV